LTRAVTGSKTAILAIGNADSQKLIVGSLIELKVRALRDSVSLEDEIDVEDGAANDVKPVRNRNYFSAQWNCMANVKLNSRSNCLRQNADM
jgi:hypothetical protein